MVATRPAPADAPGTQLDAAAKPSARLRRPWWERLEIWTGAAIVVACCVFVLFQLQPDLLLRNTTPAGGDTGAHVWWPAFLRDNLLPQGRIAGWAPDWFAGFPAGQFYFPFPAVVIVALDTVLPYNIAFKLVTALGPIALPAGAYAFGRGLRAPRPAPALFPVSPGTSTSWVATWRATSPVSSRSPSPSRWRSSSSALSRTRSSTVDECGCRPSSSPPS